MDDLSFEEFEIEYKYLKAVIEGGLEKKPDNILINATSNRRHLIKEEFSDKEGRRDHLHASDTVQEKLSLVSRFWRYHIFQFAKPERISGYCQKPWQNGTASPCRRRSCWPRPINGRWPTAVCPAGRRSSLSTICWERNPRMNRWEDTYAGDNVCHDRGRIVQRQSGDL